MRETFRTTILAGIIIVSIGCGGGSGGSGPNTTGGRGGGLGGSGGNGSGGQGNRGGGGGSPVGGSSGSGGGSAFRLSGTVVRTQTVLSATEDNHLALAATMPRTVTHVMAVNPSSQDPRRMLAPVAANGSFMLNLEPGRAWVLVFIDSSRIGADMIAGVFRASELDTVAPTMPGSADLGTVAVTAGTATAGIAYADLLTALNLSNAGADFLGAADDICLRYVNPDIDGDGKIDLDQLDRNFQLDFHVQFAMRVGAAASQSNGATVADIAAGFLPDSTGISYGGVGIYASYPNAFAASDPGTAWVSFQTPIHYYPGGGGPGGPRVAAADVRIPGSDLTFLGFGTYHSQGVSASAGFDLPQGRYQFGVGTRTLTFTNVRTHSDAHLTAAANFIMPFVRIVKTDGCSGDCTISAIEFKWMKRTANGWVPATVEELGLIVNEQGGYISIVKTFDNGNQHIGLTIPANVQTGTLPWGTAMLDGLTAAELAATKVSEVCHFGLSYDDKLGMRMFSGIGNAPGTCPTM